MVDFVIGVVASEPADLFGSTEFTVLGRDFWCCRPIDAVWPQDGA